MVMKFWVSLKVWNFLTNWATISFSRRTLFYRVSSLFRED